MNIVRRLGGPVRSAFARRLKTGNVILMYHRVARTSVDPWALCVSPANFAQQMEFLAGNTQVCAVEDLVGVSSAGKPSVAITFDDGYVDNLTEAAPVLQQFGYPATVFVTSGFVGVGRQFWWDELASVFLQPGRLPNNPLTLVVNGKSVPCNISAEHQEYTENDAVRYCGWRAWTAPPTSRHAAFHSVWAALQSLHVSERDVHLSAIQEWAQRPTDLSQPRCMDASELRDLSRKPGISVGAHAVTHARLADLSPAEQEAEIAGSRLAMGELVATPVRTFSYPFGGKSDYGTHAVDAVRRAGYTLACSNFEGTISPSSDRFQLPRYHAPDLDGIEFSRWWRPRFAH